MGMFDGLFGMNKNNPIPVNYEDWLGYTPIGSSSTDTFDFSPERTETIKTNFVNDGFNVDGFGNSNWFGKSGILPTAFQGLSALGGLMQAYTGFKGLELAKQQAENAANAFRTQWQNNVASTGLAAENAARVSYALSHTGGNYNKNDQMARGQSARNDVESRYKNYV